MNAKEAYKHWAAQYDTNKNRTRDLEAEALREVLDNLTFRHVLEIGCGTGKNTVWLAERAKSVMSVDLSEEMLAVARQKVRAANVQFRQADVLKPWQFADQPYDLVTFSLVLEHIETLEPVFRKASKVLKPGGFIYLGELHPFKQYSGTKARYPTGQGVQEVECYTHHLSDFTEAARQHGFRIERLTEYFDADNHQLPRILAMVFVKN